MSRCFQWLPLVEASKCPLSALDQGFRCPGRSPMGYRFSLRKCLQALCESATSGSAVQPTEALLQGCSSWPTPLQTDSRLSVVAFGFSSGFHRLGSLSQVKDLVPWAPEVVSQTCPWAPEPAAGRQYCNQTTEPLRTTLMYTSPSLKAGSGQTRNRRSVPFKCQKDLCECGGPLVAKKTIRLTAVACGKGGNAPAPLSSVLPSSTRKSHPPMCPEAEVYYRDMMLTNSMSTSSERIDTDPRVHFNAHATDLVSCSEALIPIKSFKNKKQTNIPKLTRSQIEGTADLWFNTMTQVSRC